MHLMNILPLSARLILGKLGLFVFVRVVFVFNIFTDERLIA